MTQKQISELIQSIRDRISEGAKDLVFYPEDHTYEYKGVPMTSVSHVCEIFAPEFDAEAKAAGVAKRRGVPVETVLEEWKAVSEQACEEGTAVHAYGEWRFYQAAGLPVNERDPDVSRVNEAVLSGTFSKGPREKAVDDVWEWLDGNSGRPYKLYPVAAENTVVNPELRYAGTFDLLYLLVKPDGTYGLIIFDYKTNVNLFNIFKSRSGSIETMNYPLNALYNCNVSHYMCQLNLYQLGLERVIKDVPILGRILFWVNPEGVNMINVNDPSVYNAYPESKWPRLANAAPEVDRLKKAFRFAKVGDFGMIRLPYAAPVLEKYLRARIKTTGKLK